MARARLKPCSNDCGEACVRELYSDVQLKVPLPSNGLTAGARGVVVHVHAQGEVYEVEFLTPAGETIAVVSVAEEKLEPSPQEC